MNERIQRLMIKADYAAPELAGRAHKLAELIVRECARLVDNYQDMRNPASTYKRLLLEDFGLEK